MVTFLLRNSIAPVSPILKQQLNLTDFQLGLVLSSFLWVYTLLQPIAGWATDRFGARATLFVGMLATSIITIFTGFATSLAILIVFRVFLGIAQSPNFVTGAKVSSSGWVEPNARARATSIWVAGGRIGTAIAFPFATLLSVSMGWRWAFFGTGLLGLAWCIVWLLRFQNHPGDELPISHGQRSYWSGTVRFLLSPLGLGLALASFGQGYLAYYISTWLPTYLVQDQKFTVLNAGFYSVLPILSAILGVILVGGLLSDWEVGRGASRIGFRSSLFSIGMLIASLMLFIAAYARNIASITNLGFFSSSSFVIVSLSIAGAAWGVATPSLWAALVEATPKELAGSMGGVQNFGGNLGGLVVLVFTGYILQATGQSFFALIAVSLFALLAAASATILVKPRDELRSNSV